MTFLIWHFHSCQPGMFVHVLHEGKIVKSGGKELAIELEEKGYDWIKQAI